jgi:hypothetical protein
MSIFAMQLFHNRYVKPSQCFLVERIEDKRAGELRSIAGLRYATYALLIARRGVAPDVANQQEQHDCKPKIDQ